jgi:hypothetical protein
MPECQSINNTALNSKLQMKVGQHPGIIKIKPIESY